MHSVKEKASNAAASGKEHIDIMKAKAQEKVRLLPHICILLTHKYQYMLSNTIKIWIGVSF